MDVYESFLKNPFGPTNRTVLLNYTKSDVTSVANGEENERLMTQDFADIRKIPTTILRELDTDNIKPETNVKSIVQSLPSKYSKSIEESQRKILTDFSSTLNSVPYVFKHDLSAPNQGYGVNSGNADIYYHTRNIKENDTGYSDLLNKEPVKTFVPEKMVVVDRLS